MCYFDAHVKLLGSVPEPLLAALDAALRTAEADWTHEDASKPNAFGCFEGSTRHIVLQYPVSLLDHQASEYRRAWPVWRDAVSPIVDHVVRIYGYAEGRTSRIMLARLRAGGVIGRHIDAAPAARVPHKIHVPILTSPDAVFLAEDASHHLARGFAYEVNNRIPHGGRNDGDADRIHLIFDYFDGARAE